MTEAVPSQQTPPSPAQPSADERMEQIKSNMRASWMAGDFGVIARTVASAAEEFIARLPIAAGESLLDVACGTGNSAIPAARRGAIVTGVDIASNLLTQARERAAEENLTIRFDEGDAEQLPYEDASFDVITTMFGAMFAPRPELVASEFARVLKPGGLLAMANWTPTSFANRMFQITARHVPPPPGLAPAALWGDSLTARERLQANFYDLQTEVVQIQMDMPSAPAGAVHQFRTYFGPTRMAFQQLDLSGQAALQAELEALYVQANLASDSETHTVISNEYLQITAKRREIR